MKVDVFDTHVMTNTGMRMHFDVLLPQGSEQDPEQTAMRWLEGIGVAGAQLSTSLCRFCHVEEVTPEIERAIERDGYFVLQLEGCPANAA